ncbi:hypothetical protein Tsubulata_027969 [Turnera subulata]|uniref:DUF4283 domain-containing protein n=1 Tax=Turnera subulata TaxID=218843 RepID=A0A9Q0JE30_9ROSI|nr:hypothetical protein Tsubulata_027969 [Turnera subulata]
MSVVTTVGGGPGQSPPAPPHPAPDTEMSVVSQLEPSDAPSKSFKDVVSIGPSSSFADIDTEIVAQEGDISSYMDERGPVIQLSDRFRAKVYEQWKNTVIVKLWGRPIGYRMLCSRLPRLWSLRGSFKVIDLDHNYFLVKLTDSYDCIRALADGPWVIMDHYLTVEPWQPNFDPVTHKNTTVVAWIQIPGFSCELYQTEILREVCNRIGKFIRIDYSTQRAERGRFAKAAVELDLSMPLQTEACVEGRWYPIWYESLPLVCFHYGKAGQNLSTCSTRVFVPSGVPVAGVAAASVTTPTAVPTVPSALSSSLGYKAPHSTMATQVNASSGKYGEWMLVPPKKRTGKKVGLNNGGELKDGLRVASNGSRFDVLATSSSDVQAPAEPSLSGGKYVTGMASSSSETIVSVGAATGAPKRTSLGHNAPRRGVFLNSEVGMGADRDGPVKRSQGN